MINWTALGAYASTRLHEPSTWLGVIKLFVAAGLVHFSDSDASSAAAAIVGVLGIIDMGRKERGSST